MNAASITAVITSVASLVAAITGLIVALKARGTANNAHDIGTEASVKADVAGAKADDNHDAIKVIQNGGINAKHD